MFSAENLLQYGPLGLFLVSFAESVFFPVPPDLVLLPLAMMNPGLAFWYALLCTSASVAGAVFGYLLGGKAGRPLLAKFMRKERIAEVERLFTKYGGWAVGIAAFTPIPFKVFTLTGGIFKVPLMPFLFASILGRGARFFLEGGLVFFLGDRAQTLLGRNFEMFTLGLTVAVILAIIVAQRVLPIKKVSQITPFGTWRKKLTLWVQRQKRKEPLFFRWAGLSIMFLLVFVAFLEDLAGPERDSLNRFLLPVFTRFSFLGEPFQRFQDLGKWPFVVPLLLLGVPWHVVRKDGLDRGKTVRAGRAVSGTIITSHNLRQFLRFGAVFLFLYLLEQGRFAFMVLAYSGGFLFPQEMVMLAPAAYVLSALLLATGFKMPARIISVSAASYIGFGLVGSWVLLGFLEPAAAGATVLGSAFGLFSSLALLHYRR